MDGLEKIWIASRDISHAQALGEILLKKKPGRRSENETTVYKSMGHAMEDLVAANLVYQKAVGKKMGKMIKL